MSKTQKLEEAVWRSPDSDVRVWADFDGDFVLYHRPSGTTHFLNPSGKQVIDALSNTPMTTADIAALFAELVADDLQASVINDVGAMLLRFEDLGLIHRV